MGRKRTHHDATRTKIVSARLTHETYNLISEHAAKLGLTRAGYIEHLIEDRPLRIVRPISDELPITFLNELKRVGNNLNQIAHARNAGQDVDPRQFRTVVTQIVATICSNEVMRRRYADAEADVARKEGRVVEEQVRLRAAPAMPSQRQQGSPPKGAAVAAPPDRPPATPAPNPPAAPVTPPRPPETIAAASQPREIQLSQSDIANRLYPPDRNSVAKSPKSAFREAVSRTEKINGPQTSSSWFKLPWRK